MEEGNLLEKIERVLKKSRGEPSKFIELITYILKSSREGEIVSYPKIVRKIWPEEWQKAEDKVEFEIAKWDLLRRRRREINERIFHSHICFDFFIELSQEKQFSIITDPKEICHKRFEELEQNMARAKSKTDRERIRALIIELVDKFQEYAKVKVEVVSERPQATEIPDKASIAVTPFVNMSGDTGLEYFSDGITENIIIALSNTPNMLMIAYNPTFTYKDELIKLQQVTREQGARYLLRGTVQRIDNRVRISAQLIDTTVGQYLWADRWDRDLRDIFVLQDEITMKIVEAIQVTLTEGNQVFAWGKGTDNIEAYRKALQARYHWELMTIDGNIRARKLAEQVVALDPEYATGYTLLGNVCLWNLFLRVSDDWSRITDRAFQLAQKALNLDDSNYYTYILLGMVHLCRKQHEQAIAAVKRSMALDPNSAICLEALGAVLWFVGSPEVALLLLKKALCLSSLPNSRAFYLLGEVYKSLGRYEEAIAAFKNATNAQPNHCATFLHLGASYYALGHKHEARAAVAEALRINPNYTLEREEHIIGLHKNPDYREHLIDLIHKVGLR